MLAVIKYRLPGGVSQCLGDENVDTDCVISHTLPCEGHLRVSINISGWKDMVGSLTSFDYPVTTAKFDISVSEIVPPNPSALASPSLLFILVAMIVARFERLDCCLSPSQSWLSASVSVDNVVSDCIWQI